MVNDPTTRRIVLTSVWCRHADVEGISAASRRMFAARKRVQRRLREALAGFRFAVEHSQPNSRIRTLGLA
jgi:hypothetical protein